MSTARLRRILLVACLPGAWLCGALGETSAAAFRAATPVASAPDAIAAAAGPSRKAKTAVPKPAADATAPVDTNESAAILARVAQSYRGFDSYQFEGTVRLAVNVQDKVQNLELPFTISAAKPGKYRAEISNPMIQMVNVSDGQQTWNYVPQLGQFTKKMVTPLKGDAVPAPNPVVSATPLARYLSMDQGSENARLVRMETVGVEGQAWDCYVIETTFQRPMNAQMGVSPTTFWIDKTRHVVLRESTTVKLASSPTGGPMEMNQVTTFEVARVNQPLPDSMFIFQPPADAKEVDEITMPGLQPPQSELVGKPALPFKLKNLRGKETTLASWKGKVVLLDFWASWCGPCRIEMPVIAKLDKELRAKGLVVVAVNVGETAAVASGYLKKNNYTFAALLDSDSQISDRYGATGIPTVVIIDRRGNVSSHFIGVRPEQVLREALKKAGL